MSYQAVSGTMDVPVCPEQPGGWITAVYHDNNLAWKIHAKRGTRADRNLEIRIFERLSQDDVRKFDITKRR